MAMMLNDLRVALRQLGRRPVFTATAVLTLAIGMGVNTVAFTVVNALLFKGSATSGHPDVGRVATTPGGDEGGYGSLPDYQRFADATRGTLELAAEGGASLAWRHDGASDTAWVLFVSPNYFSIRTWPSPWCSVRSSRSPASPPPCGPHASIRSSRSEPNSHPRLFIRNVAVPWKNSRRKCVTSGGSAA